MKFKRHIRPEQGLEQINMAPLIDIIFLLLIFFMLTSSYSFQSGINVKLPKAVTSDTLRDENFIVTVTSENVVYLKDRIVTVKELRDALQQMNNRQQSILIKADRRASMGRIVEVWDLCREYGINKVNIATNKDN